MKPIYLIVAAVSISLSACSQNIPTSKIPSVVLNSVQAKYPGAAGVEWEKKKKLYEAEFKIDSIEHTIHFDAGGKMVRHETEIKAAALPSGIAAAIKTQYADYVVDDVALVEENGHQFYEVELEAKGKKDKKVVFSTDGKTISNS